MHYTRNAMKFNVHPCPEHTLGPLAIGPTAPSSLRSTPTIDAEFGNTGARTRSTSSATAAACVTTPSACRSRSATTAPSLAATQTDLRQMPALQPGRASTSSTTSPTGVLPRIAAIIAVSRQAVGFPIARPPLAVADQQLPADTIISQVNLGAINRPAGRSTTLMNAVGNQN